jgi:uncharacterized protein (TIGR00730 family)
MNNNSPQKDAPAYRLAALDSDFLLGDSMRGVRFLLEYAKAEELLRSWGVRSTLVVFGSARVLPGGSADPSASTAPLAPNAPPKPGWRSAIWYEEARRFGRIASERGGALTPVDGIRDNVIATGGGPGIMEAANRGAAEAGAPSIGFNIRLPREQEPNGFSTPDLTFQFHYFAMRKMHLAMRASALVVFPGGFGTFDELFEILNLVQTRKMPRVPIVCIDRDYWRRVVNLEAMAEDGMITKEDRDLLSFADDAEEAWSILVASGLKLPTAAPRPNGPTGRDI